MTEHSLAEDSPACASPTSLSGVEALILVLVCFALMWTVGGWLASRYGVAGLGLAEFTTILAPTLIWLRVRRVTLTNGLGLKRVGGRNIVGAVFIGLGAFYVVSAVIEALQEKIIPLPLEIKRQLREMIVPARGLRPLAVDLIVLALIPALCEEALFRGAVLGALRRLGPGAAIVGAALFFGFFHGSLWRVIPTGSLGLAMGLAAWRAGSLWPAILVHLINNMIVIVMVRAGHDDVPSNASPLGLALLLGAGALFIAGIYLVGAGRTKREIVTI